MLTSASRFTDRPAALSSRRPFLYGALAALVAVSAASCGGRTPLDFDGARSVVRRAIRTVRPSSPSQARYIERLLADAEVATAGEAAAPWWNPQTGRAAAAWLRVLRVTRGAVSSYRSMEDATRAGYDILLPSTRHEVSRARAEIWEAGMGRREAAAMERAAVSLATAERLAAGRRWGRAADKLEEARASATIVHKGWLALHARFSNRTLIRQWRTWAEETIAESRDRGEYAFIVDKLHRQLTVYYRGLRVATYSADLGVNGLRRKERSGDRATPEGRYHVVELKEGRKTAYYKALLLDYPNADDRARFERSRRRGTIPSRAGIGSLIEIHGDGGDGRDWTDGCIALANSDMDKVFARARAGTPVTIVGTYEH